MNEVNTKDWRDWEEGSHSWNRYSGPPTELSLPEQGQSILLRMTV